MGSATKLTITSRISDQHKKKSTFKSLIKSSEKERDDVGIVYNLPCLILKFECTSFLEKKNKKKLFLFI